MKLLILIFLILFVSGCTEKEEEKTVTPKKENAPQTQSTDPAKEAIKFWQHIAQGEVDMAITLANTLVKTHSGKVDPFYLSLLKEEGIKESFLQRQKFNKVDAFFWHQAQYFKSLTREIISSPKDPIESLYDMTVNKIQSKGEAQDVGVYPFHIWQRGFGACDRQSWAMCELVYQLGGKASIIYLRDPVTKVSPHTICEVIFKDKHYIIDILNKKFLTGTKFTDLTKEKITEVWHEKPKLHNTFDQAVRLIPAMPIDYTERNQRLNARLGKLIRFAEPPQNRYHFWKGIYPEMDIRFWDYSLRILKNTQFYQDNEK